MSKVATENTMKNGQLRAYTFVGSYPVFYLNTTGYVQCSACASDCKELVASMHINWENENLYCDDCSAAIESAYGECEARQ